MPLLLHISQSGSSLSGTSTEKEGSVVTTNTGTIALNGSFTITEKQDSSVYGVLVGSITGPGHLSGTWSSTANQGTWLVNNPPVPVNLHGTYSGTFNGSQSGNMVLTLTSTGFTLTGTTCEGCTSTPTFDDVGVLQPNGSLTITEYQYPGTTTEVAVLTGGITNYGQLSGTWSGGTSSGTWTVSAV
jgi:hypothetical protein